MTLNLSELKDVIYADSAISALIPNTKAIAEALSAGRTKTGNLTAHDIRQYLMLVDLLLPIEASNSDTCKATTRALEVFPIFDMTNPMIAGKFTQVLDSLVADTLVPDFTEVHKTTILSLALIPDPISEQDVILALYNNDGSLK